MADQIILSVPAKLEFLSTVENFVDVIIQHFNVDHEKKFSHMLRTTVNEAFVNILEHTPMPEEGMVTIIFELNPPTLNIRFPDKGKGLKVAGSYPPYPEQLIGSEHQILKTLDGELYAKIESPVSVKLIFKEIKYNLNRDDLIKNLGAGGMGLSIIVKFMDEVRFIFDENRGHCLEVKKRFSAQ